MLYKVAYSSQFKKDWKRCVRQGLPMEKLRHVISFLAEGKKLPDNYKVHQLKGERKGQWECHIQPDWLLVWEVNDDNLVLLLLTTGSHSYIFGK